MKYLLYIFTLLCAVAFSGCSTVNTAERAQAQSSPQMVNDKRIITDGALNDYAYIAGINESRVGGLLKIQVRIVNSTSAYRSVNYKFTWIDKDGMEIESATSPWMTLVLEGGEEKRASLFSPQLLGALIRMRETKLLKQTDEELVGEKRRERAVFFLLDGQSDQSDTVLSSPQLQHLRADPVPILARLRRVPLLEGLDAAEKQDGGVVEIRAAEISLPTPHEHFGVKATGPFGAVQHALGGTVFQQVPQPRRGQLQTLVPTVVSVPRDFQDPPFLDSFLKNLPSADAGDAQVFESVLQKARRIFSTAAQRDGEQGEHFLPGTQGLLSHSTVWNQNLDFDWIHAAHLPIYSYNSAEYNSASLMMVNRLSLIRFLFFISCV